MNNSINFVLQGKGGVGKSLISAILSQYFMDHKGVKDLVVADTDPVNATTARTKRLEAAVIPIMENNKIIQSKFDGMFEKILTSNENTFVIDNGASTFLPMLQYLNDNAVLDMFNDVDQDVYIHTVIVGGQATSDTIEGFESITKLVNGTNVKIIVWINEFQGVPKIGAKNLVDTNFFEKNVSTLAGAVVIKNRNSDAFDDDIKAMTEKSLTLKEVEEMDSFGLMAKARLKRVFNDIYLQLDNIYEAS